MTEEIGLMRKGAAVPFERRGISSSILRDNYAAVNWIFEFLA